LNSAALCVIRLVYKQSCAITGSFKPGTAYTAVAPCNANSAPTVCPTPPRYPLNSLGTINLKTGAVGRVAVNGVVAPKGLIFVP
jgi:hypothetical protein